MNKLFRKNLFNSSFAEACEKINEKDEETGLEQVFAELYQVIQHCDYSVQKCIPRKFITFLKENMDKQWKGELDFSMQLNDMPMLSETRALISLIYRDFLCTESERQEIIEKERREAEEAGMTYDLQSLMELLDLIN